MTQKEVLNEWAKQLAKLDDQSLIFVWNFHTAQGTTTDPQLLAGIAAEIMKRNIDLTNQ
jgi:hypothetical protein